MNYDTAASYSYAVMKFDETTFELEFGKHLIFVASNRTHGFTLNQAENFLYSIRFGSLVALTLIDLDTALV